MIMQRGGGGGFNSHTQEPMSPRRDGESEVDTSAADDNHDHDHDHEDHSHILEGRF
jgi:hypothetical protein